MQTKEDPKEGLRKNETLRKMASETSGKPSISCVFRRTSKILDKTTIESGPTSLREARLQ
eukprot:905189-Amphidinium_carterae.1